MRLPTRISFLFFLGIFIDGSTALGYYYYFVYEPPLKAAARFMADMERHDEESLKREVIVSSDIEEGRLREPTDREIKNLILEGFQRGRILDQRRQEGKTRDFFYLVYREPDGRVYALITTEFNGRFQVVIPEMPVSQRHRYLWDYSWTN